MFMILFRNVPVLRKLEPKPIQRFIPPTHRESCCLLSKPYIEAISSLTHLVLYTKLLTGESRCLHSQSLHQIKTGISSRPVLIPKEPIAIFTHPAHTKRTEVRGHTWSTVEEHVTQPLLITGLFLFCHPSPIKQEVFKLYVLYNEVY